LRLMMMMTRSYFVAIEVLLRISFFVTYMHMKA
jgi:hypothetical protein